MNDMKLFNATRLDDVSDLRDMVQRMSSDLFALGRLVDELQRNDEPKPIKPSHVLGPVELQRISVIVNQWVTIDMAAVLLNVKPHTVDNLLWKLRRSADFTVERQRCKGHTKMYLVKPNPKVTT